MSWNPLDWLNGNIPRPSTTVGTGGSRSPLSQRMQLNLRDNAAMQGRFKLQQGGPFRVDAPRQATPHIGGLGANTNPATAVQRFNQAYPSSSAPASTPPTSRISTGAKPITPKAGSIKPNIPGSRVVGGAVRVGGFATAISPDQRIGADERLLGAASAINPMMGTALAAGAGIGQWMQENLAINTAGSGRGEGRSSFNASETPPTAQPPKSSSGNVTRIGGKEYDLSDPTQKAAYDKVIAADRATRPDQKFADLRGSSGRNAEPPTENPNNIEQKGTIMGRSSLSMKDAQEYVGKDVQITNPFLSNALPGTNNDGYSYEDDLVMGASRAEAATRAGGGEIQVDIDGSGTIETKMVQGSPNLVLSGTGSAAASDVKTNDIKDPSTWDENYARRRAFLDADSSMAGLKAVQAQKGIVYAGDKYYMNTGKEDDKGNTVLNAIEGPDAKKDVRAYLNSPLGAQGAEDLKNKYIDKITKKTEEEEDKK